MAFNGGSPFGQPTQHAFSQAVQQQPGATSFGAANGSASPPNGKITFGLQAAAKQPVPTNSIFGQPAGVVGSGTAQGASTQGNGFGAFGGGTSMPSSTSFGSLSPTFGSTAPAWNGPATFGSQSGAFRSGGTASGPGAASTQAAMHFGSSNALASSFGNSDGFGSVSAGLGAVISSASPFSGAQQANQGFGALAGGQPANQGFGAFGNSSATGLLAGNSQPAHSTSFAQVNGQPDPQSASQTQSPGGTSNPFGAFGQSTHSTGAFGTAQSAAAIAFGSAAATGRIPFGSAVSGSQAKPEFGRAAKRKQQEAQHQQQPQPQHAALASQQPNSPVSLLSKQITSQRQNASTTPTAQQSALGSFADPAALAARSARFGGQQSAKAGQAPAAVHQDNASNEPQQASGGNADGKITFYALYSLPLRFNLHIVSDSGSVIVCCSTQRRSDTAQACHETD